MSILNINGEIFNKRKTEDKPMLVEFWAPWCVYCRRIAPAMEKVAEKYAETIDICQVNIDDEPQLAEQEKIEVVPTMIIYKGGQAVASIIAPDSKAKIEEFIDSNIAK